MSEVDSYVTMLVSLIAAVISVATFYLNRKKDNHSITRDNIEDLEKRLEDMERRLTACEEDRESLRRSNLDLLQMIAELRELHHVKPRQDPDRNRRKDFKSGIHY